jgi:hypothetical protein
MTAGKKVVSMVCYSVDDLVDEMVAQMVVEMAVK